MNGYELLNKAVRLLGMETPDEGMKLAGQTALYEVMTDLGFHPVSSLSEEIGVFSPTAVSALTFGLAATLSLCMGDEVAHGVLSKEYGRKRGALLSSAEQVRDTVFGGGAL